MPSGLPIFWAGSVEKSEKPVKLATGGPILGRDGQCAPELRDGRIELTLLDVDAGKVDVRIVSGFVSGCAHRLPEPRDRLLGTAQGDQIRADVVVRVPEVRVDRDRPMAFADCAFVIPLRGQGPTEKGVGLGRRHTRE